MNSVTICVRTMSYETIDLTPKGGFALSREQDQLNRIFLTIIVVFSAIYGVAFVLLLVFHLLQVPVMVALMGVWVIIGLSWMTLDGLIERKARGRIHVSHVRTC